jgi:pimeloyl-ACP methyl ester carboxylesterase
MIYLGYGCLGLLAGIVAYIFRFGPKLPPEIDAIIDAVMSRELPELIHGQTGFVRSHGLQIWYESIGPQTPPSGTLLLNMSTAGSALEWSPSFTRTFVDAGFRVIRYDHRGTGMSDWVAGWERKHAYAIADMADDALAILDALDVESVHVLGVSLGGMVAQEIALKNPDRVASLTLLMTSGDVGDADIPSLSSRYLLTSLLRSLPLLKYRILGGEKNLIKERVAKFIALVGEDGLDVKEMAEMFLYDLRKRRGLNLGAVFQHLTAAAISGSRHDRLKCLDIPALVVHGTSDPIFPVEHGKKLVETLPNATGLWLDGVAHVWPYPDMPAIMRAILSHLSSAQASS